ncbi:OmpP1/FadL family transporter [Nitrosomonas ureae]|uniref:Long-chain fatty acid transport protein n=1 Tax=Nitrosomonas ureae TaxID=44577 RepID=A0A286A3G4_9PROT|nr:outer membrane protein transport protein [Nitrosomonas ureae]SOD16448.1 long-chain fatty acid transport protein [Nitrosomonas ureae]
MRCIAEGLSCWKFLYRAGLILLVASAPVSGAGIAVMEHSVKELGQAFSGAPTNTSDGSMVFFNPAAMSQVRGKLISAASYYIAPSATFHDSASRLGNAPLTGGNGGDAGQSVFIPNFYYVQELSNRVAFGFGFNLPYGMRNSYDSDWKGRYQAIDSEVLTINFNPSLSFKLTEKFSLGAGFNVQYLRSKLTNAIDLGPACFLVQGALPCLSQGIAPQAADGHVSLKGDSVGFGYNLGAFYTLTPDTRFGVSYRSRIAHDVKGNANFTLPDKAIALTQGNILVDTHAVTPVTLPDSVLFGFSHYLNPRWEVSADALWTHWSLVRELRTNFSSSQSDDVQNLKWNDTWRYAFGVNYFSAAHKWVWRTGFAYDQTPVPNAQHRSPRIPDSDRYWLTVGFTYAVRNNISIHGAYAHLFMDTPSISRRGVTGDFLSGQFSEQINIGGLQLDWRF